MMVAVNHTLTDLGHASGSNAILWFHLAVWIVLAAYGLHRLHLICLYRKRRPTAVPPEPAEWPRVTIQLPIYDERYVAERLLEAAAAVDYPRERLEIQVLDDSEDETAGRMTRAVAALRDRGVDAVHIRRGNRAGYKAGALEHGLARAKGDLIAIFDADFVPQPDMLKRMVPHFADPRVGMVQARWKHLNRDYSLLARLQAISLDAHFLVEHTARMSADRYFNFNGTAGILRRTCIEDAGGWQSDTLTEDLDLSYRAQLKGWRFVFAGDVGCPGELPVEMNAFKAQQHRWVRGSIQVARKLLPRIWKSEAPLGVKLEATFHLTSNVPYVLLLLLSLIVYPVVLARYSSRSVFFLAADSVLLIAATAPVLAYFAQVERGSALKRLRWVPLVMTLGIGLAVNNTRAVLEGLFCRAGAFHRTPKFRLEARRDRWRGKRYRSPLRVHVLLELAFGLYFAWAMLALARAGLWAPLPFFVLYLFGFLYVGGLSVAHASRRS
ncbi:MAG TPA: glycosyltransferase [Candidatus Eisenbacteria bacterium]|nr:glycosyltransferase [Candidatus Eisenbacteria bacterium]